MHYGHPDVFDRVFHVTRGGISKASRVINISEDIFAGKFLALCTSYENSFLCSLFSLLIHIYCSEWSTVANADQLLGSANVRLLKINDAIHKSFLFPTY